MFDKINKQEKSRRSTVRTKQGKFVADVIFTSSTFRRRLIDGSGEMPHSFRPATLQKLGLSWGC